MHLDMDSFFLAMNYRLFRNGFRMVKGDDKGDGSHKKTSYLKNDFILSIFIEHLTKLKIVVFVRLA